MIQLVKTITNTKGMLIGFIIKAKGTELGECTNEEVQRTITLKALSEKNFVNNQVIVSNNGITERNNFKLNDLPMAVYANNGLIDIDNRIALIKRYLNGKDVIGFRIKYADGVEADQSCANVIRLGYWFKPYNFVIRTYENGKKYIAGKSGMLKLDDLPSEDLGVKKKQNKGVKKQKVNSAVQSAEVVAETGYFNIETDIIDICEALKNCNGLVLKLPSEEYKRTKASTTKVDSAFSELGVGEFAYPEIEFNETKLNANLLFRKPGIVNIGVDGGLLPIQTYIYSEKCVFVNGENYIKNLGLAIPSEVEQDFVNNFGKSMSIRKIEDTKLIKSVETFTHKNNMVYYKLDTDNIDIMSKSKVNSYVMPTEKLYKVVDSYFTIKAITKYLHPRTGLIGKLKKSTGLSYNEFDDGVGIDMYKKFGKDLQEDLKCAGINLKTGAFEKLVPISEEEKTESNVVKSKENSVVAIEYMIKGKELKKWTASKIAEAGKTGKGLPDEVIKVVQTMENIVDEVERMKQAVSLYKEYNGRVNKLKNIIWLHKCAMYVSSNKSVIHQHDKHNWKRNETSKAKATLYDCEANGCEGLVLAVLNTSI